MNRIIMILIQSPTMFLFFFSFIFSIPTLSIAVDNINTTQFLKDGETLVSSGGSFELGFFSPSKGSKNRYVGIWYKKISVRTVVWVANRVTPLTNTSGELRLIQPGILALFSNETSRSIWSTNTKGFLYNPVAQLLDSGNFVVKESGDDYNFLWQSFDYPGDTLLPGMKHGVDLVTGLDRNLRSWRSNDDPSLGNFTYGYERQSQGYPQLILRNNSVVQFRSGPWNGLGFSGMPNLKKNTVYRLKFVFNEKEGYFIYDLDNSSTISRFILNSEGALRRLIWVDRTKTWVLNTISVQRDACDTYKLCGAHGTCSIEISPPCQCLDKFVPKYPSQWENADWTNGCVRRTPLNCQTDGFIKYSAIKLPDTGNSWFSKTISLKNCEALCLKNCFCTAYTSLDIRNGGSGCLIWYIDLLDIRKIPQNGQDIYIRMAASELEQSGSKEKKRFILIVSLPVVLGAVLLVFSLFLCSQRKKSGPNREGREEPNIQHDHTKESQKEDLELPLFGLHSIAKATDNFSIDCKLGEGGFGAVYKGVLEDGQEIAVKRLSKTSRQGLDEFKNEVVCITKLQHRNLVKLLGCCIEEEETILIYEYMPNKSLDSFIFEETQRSLLDWPKRFSIINGIARGLLYLHQDSRLRIIHRDLKAGNVLLDANMNAKISDFGLARSFAENETRGRTKRVVGTYGYMSPEYAVDGLFSLKSDVFSFGVLALEIVSGKRNRGFFHQDHQHNLLGHAWRLFNEDKSMELIDESLGDSCRSNEVLRSIHVGLLCVQQRLEERPSMSSVVLMLGGEGTLPLPKQPGFFTERSIIEPENSSSTNPPSSINEVTITVLDVR